MIENERMTRRGSLLRFAGLAAVDPAAAMSLLQAASPVSAMSTAAIVNRPAFIPVDLSNCIVVFLPN